jgi:hypothetical protein
LPIGRGKEKKHNKYLPNNGRLVLFWYPLWPVIRVAHAQFQTLYFQNEESTRKTVLHRVSVRFAEIESKINSKKYYKLPELWANNISRHQHNFHIKHNASEIRIFGFSSLAAS